MRRRVRRGYTDGRYGQLHHRRIDAAKDAGKPALVMFHQNPSSSGEYETLMATMAADRAVVAFDMPGCGMSDRPPVPLSIAGYVEALAEGMDALRLGEDRPVDLFGFHTGTFMATEMALVRPARVGRLVLTGIPFRSAEERAARLADAKAVRIDEQGDEAFALMREMWQHQVTDRLPGVDLDIAIRTFLDKSAPMHRRAWAYHGVWTYDAAGRLPLVHQSVMVLQHDEPLKPLSRKAAALFPNGRCGEVSGLTRDIFEVGADTLARAMRAFLT